MTLDDHRHPGAERLAEYAEGTLDARGRADVEAHLADCADCRAVVAETMAFMEAEPAVASAPAPAVLPFRPRTWMTAAAAGLAIAAALALALVIDRPGSPRGDRPELLGLIAAVNNEPTRLVEGRLTGGFKYGVPPSPTRGAGDREVSPAVRIAAATVERDLGNQTAPSSIAALGVAYLAVGDLDRAIESLGRAAASEPSNARYQSDLSAAYIARARRRGTADDWSAARAAAERAVSTDPALIEAWFNRALAIEGGGSPDEASRAWRDYLDRDSSSPWAQERRSAASRP